MTCSNKPNYTPFELTGLAPTKQWGLGRSAGYERFNPEEFHALEDTFKITFPVDFRGKVKGSLSPNPSNAEGHNDQMYPENILRGSKFLSKPTLLFNGAEYNESTLSNGAAVATTQRYNQGLMFYWEEFIKPIKRIKEGDLVTFSVDVRSTGEDIPTNAVAFKGTSNFEDYYHVIEQPVTKEFTRITYSTRFLSENWEWDEAFAMFWGAENPPVTDYPSFKYDKNKLAGFIQAEDSIQLEFARPMVSVVGASNYIEAGEDFYSANKWDFKKATQWAYINYQGLWKTKDTGGAQKEDWAMKEFIPIKDGASKLSVYKLTTQTVPPNKDNVYGNIAFYSAANEESFVSAKLLGNETGKYGGYLSIADIPTGAAYYRIGISAVKGDASARVFVQQSNDNWTEFRQEWYDAIANKLDGNVARAETVYRKEPVAMQFNIDFKSAVEKVLPKVFADLSTDEEKQQRLRGLADIFTTSVTARSITQGVGGLDLCFWRWLPDGTKQQQVLQKLYGKGLTTVVHPSTYQEWINPKGEVVSFVKSNKLVADNLYNGEDTLSGYVDSIMDTVKLEVNGVITDITAEVNRNASSFVFKGLTGKLKESDNVRLLGYYSKEASKQYFAKLFWANKPADVEEYNQLPFIEVDHVVMTASITVTQSQLDEWGFNPNLPDYRMESLERPISTTEEYMFGSMVQVTHAYDVYGYVESNYPEFFGDCYTFDDRIRKINERIKEFNLVATPIDTDEVPLGSREVLASAEARNPDRDYLIKTELDQTVEMTINNSKGHFIHSNGYIYVGFARKTPSDRESSMALDSSLSFSFLMDRQYDSLPRVFRYNYQKQPWFLFVRNINRSVLAPKVNSLTPINGGTRRYNFGASEDARYISMDCFIKAPAEEDMPKLMEELADFLDVGETVIQFSDNKDRYYKVMLDGSTDLSQTLHVGTLTLTFVMLENTAVGKQVVETVEIDSTEGSVPFIELNNMGTADAYPTYQLTFDEPAGYVDLVGTDTSANVSIGRRPKDTNDETKVDLRPRKFYSKFTTTDGAGWMNMNDTQLPNFEGVSAKLQGSVQRANGIGNQDKWNYGDTNHKGHHGAGIIANLQKNVDDFYLEASVVATGKPVKNSLNAIFVVFYDENNSPIAYMKVGSRPQEGNLDCYVAYASDWTKRRTLYNGTKWKDFWGKVSVQRRDNRWRLVVGQYSNRKTNPAPESVFNYGQGMLKDTMDTGWFDLPSESWGKKFARVGVFFSQYHNRPKLGHLSLRRLIVWENLENYRENPIEGTPIMFHEGDTVVIDSNKAQTYLNGELTPALVDPMTDWFPITKGDNYIGVNNFKGKIDIVYNERFK